MNYLYLALAFGAGYIIAGGARRPAAPGSSYAQPAPGAPRAAAGGLRWSA